jgi:hypothetical protein
MVTHRWWGNKFCKRTCKGAYLREVALGRDKIHRRYGFFCGGMPDAVGRFLNKEGIQWALRRVLHEVRRSPCRGSRQQAKHAVIVTSENSYSAAHRKYPRPRRCRPD